MLACCLAFWPLCVASTCLPGVTSSVASSFFIVRTEAQVNRHLHSIVSLSLPRAGRSKGKCSTRLSSHSRAGWSACRGSFFTPHAHVQQTSCDHVHLVVLLWGRVSTALCRWCRLWPTRVAQKGSCSLGGNRLFFFLLWIADVSIGWPFCPMQGGRQQNRPFARLQPWTRGPQRPQPRLPAFWSSSGMRTHTVTRMR